MHSKLQIAANQPGLPGTHLSAHSRRPAHDCPDHDRDAAAPRKGSAVMPKRVLQGTVVSDKNDKTVVVLVERRFTHPVLKKTVRLSKRYHAHDETNAVKVGDRVQIQECRPVSKLKKWEVVRETA